MRGIPLLNGRGLLLLLLAILGGLLAFALSPKGPGSGAGNVITTTLTANLAAVLAPFLVLATAIERFWEAVFSWYESFALASGRLLGSVGAISRWAKTEAENAARAVEEAANTLGATSPGTADYDGALRVLQETEARLLEAQSRIASALKSPEYVALKRGITLLGSLVLGLSISISGRLMLLKAAGISIPSGLGPLDILITGLLIGAGPGPLHSFITGLQELRNSLAGLADLARGSALKKVSDALPMPASAANPAEYAAPMALHASGPSNDRLALPASAAGSAASSSERVAEAARLERLTRRLFPSR